MSVCVSRAVWEHSRATGAARLVLLAIADRASRDGVAWPTQAELAERTLLSGRQVSRCIGELVEGGELEVREFMRGRVRRNAYRIRLPGVVEEVDVARLDKYAIRLLAPSTKRHDVTSSADLEVQFSDTSDRDEVTFAPPRSDTVSPPRARVTNGGKSTVSKNNRHNRTAASKCACSGDEAVEEIFDGLLRTMPA